MVRDLHTAENEGAAFCILVDVVAYADTGGHFGKSVNR